MKYEVSGNDHVIDLTPEETDRFFEPFEKYSDEMPSHLFHVGHRYIKEDIYNWLVTSVGDPSIDWASEGTRNSRAFRFKTKDKAMLFKLCFFGTSEE